MRVKLFLVLAFQLVLFGSLASPLNLIMISRNTNITTMVRAENTSDSKLKEDKVPALILLSTESIDSMDSCIEQLKSMGGVVKHVFPPHVIIAKITMSIESQLLEYPGVESVSFSAVDPTSVSKYGDEAVAGVEAWNNHFMKQAAEKGLEPPKNFKEPPPIKDDMKAVPEEEERSLPSSTSSSYPYGAGFYDTSEYMIGDISVGIILPESNGAIDPNRENWVLADITSVMSEIMAGLDWWAEKEPAAHLTFSYQLSVVPTSYEPISRPSTDQYLWISEVMRRKGYTYGSYFYKVYDYLNNLRYADHSDWAVTIFVIHSFWDLDGAFSDGYFAYAYLGGPFIVMTYDNDGYFLFNMDAVTAHEFGHTFYALDEYYSAMIPPTATSGYLNIANENTEYGGYTNYACIMRSQVAPYSSGSICPSTRGQIGWRDTDGDLHLDIVDFFPTTFLYPYDPDPTNNPNPNYSGYGNATQCYPNNNPFSYGHDITINCVERITYFVFKFIEETSSWFHLYDENIHPDYDSAIYSFGFTISNLDSGLYYIVVCCMNSENMVSDGSFDYLTVDILPPSVPILLSPLNGAPITNDKPTFSWNPASDSLSGVASYTLQLDTSTSFNSANLREVSGITGTSYTPNTALLSGTWYWRVRAVDMAQNAGEYSSYWSVTVSVGLFQDGFESGSFSKWSGTTKTTGETASVVTTLKHHGVYSAKFTSNGGGGTERSFCYKTIASSTVLYARGYFYVSQSGMVENGDQFFFMVFRAGTNDVALAGWKKTSSGVKWCLRIRHGTSWVAVNSAASPALNQWYCVEVQWQKSSTAGLGKLYVNGALVCSITGKNTTAYGNVNQVRFGLPQINNCGPTTANCDCTKISSTYIGPE